MHVPVLRRPEFGVVGRSVSLINECCFVSSRGCLSLLPSAPIEADSPALFHRARIEAASYFYGTRRALPSTTHTTMADYGSTSIISITPIDKEEGIETNHPRNISNRSSMYETVNPNTMGNFFFNIGGGQEEDDEEMAELEKGKEFEATVTL